MYFVRSLLDIFCEIITHSGLTNEAFVEHPYCVKITHSYTDFEILRRIIEEN